MAELKTKATKEDPSEFLKTITPAGKRADSFALLELLQKVTGEKPVMWGTSIVGFGMYHYKSERSSQEGDWPRVAFSPRKQNLTLYVLSWKKHNLALLNKLGKHKVGGGCLYINHLADVDIHILSELIEEAWHASKEVYK